MYAGVPWHIVDGSRAVDRIRGQFCQLDGADGGGGAAGRPAMARGTGRCRAELPLAAARAGTRQLAEHLPRAVRAAASALVQRESVMRAHKPGSLLGSRVLSGSPGCSFCSFLLFFFLYFVFCFFFFVFVRSAHGDVTRQRLLATSCADFDPDGCHQVTSPGAPARRAACSSVRSELRVSGYLSFPHTFFISHHFVFSCLHRVSSYCLILFLLYHVIILPDFVYNSILLHNSPFIYSCVAFGVSFCSSFLCLSSVVLILGLPY